MAQVLVNFRMDAENKKEMDEVSVDPFYSESNLSYLKRITAQIDSGEAPLTEHKLMED